MGGKLIFYARLPPRSYCERGHSNKSVVVASSFVTPFICSDGGRSWLGFTLGGPFLRCRSRSRARQHWAALIYPPEDEKLPRARSIVCFLSRCTRGSANEHRYLGFGAIVGVNTDDGNEIKKRRDCVVRAIEADETRK